MTMILSALRLESIIGFECVIMGDQEKKLHVCIDANKPGEDWERVLRKAAKEGYSNIIRRLFFCKIRETLSNKELGYALTDAAEHGHGEIVAQFFPFIKTGKITKKECRYSLEQAVKNKHVEIVKQLTAFYKKQSCISRSEITQIKKGMKGAPCEPAQQTVLDVITS
ncbi:MAG: hypothetical protein JWO53_862 [Chlamydiia bacterium]|nr:hypothetical protein [Chlamydiia bacterium]